jgi:hypothetical protein
MGRVAKFALGLEDDIRSAFFALHNVRSSETTNSRNLNITIEIADEKRPQAIDTPGIYSSCRTHAYDHNVQIHRKKGQCRSEN